jgi:oligopeptidase B
MHGLNAPLPRPLAAHPRRAARGTPSSTAVEWSMSIAWLARRHRQEVMRDPCVLDADIRTYLEAENAYTEAALADTLTCSRRCLPR